MKKKRPAPAFLLAELACLRPGSLLAKERASAFCFFFLPGRTLTFYLFVSGILELLVAGHRVDLKQLAQSVKVTVQF